MIRLITDSTADLGADLLARRAIHTVPLNVTIADQVYKDGLEIDLEKLFALVDEHKQLPKTSTPTIQDFLATFDPSAENVYIGISSRLSSTCQNAQIAAEEWQASPVHVIDSLNLSTGIGLLVLKAADLRDAGASLEEIVATIQAAIPKVRTSFTIDTLEYLHMGGRCTALEHIVGSLLRIRPVIEVRADGTLGVKEKVRGSREKALAAMLDDFRANLPDIDLARVFVTHSGCGADARYLKQEIERIAAPDEVWITRAGAVIGSHCGPNTIGILYLIK